MNYKLFFKDMLKLCYKVRLPATTLCALGSLTEILFFLKMRCDCIVRSKKGKNRSTHQIADEGDGLSPGQLQFWRQIDTAVK